MKLKKWREWFVEAKLYVARASGYLSILSFLMVVLIFLNTTLWEYQPVQNLFHDKKMFIAISFVIVTIGIAIVGYIDTKYKIWRTESERMLTPERSPHLVPLAFQCAKMLSDLKKQGKDTKEIENHLNEIFERCKLTGEFEFFKSNIKP